MGSFILFQKILVMPCAVAPFPSMLLPSTPLLFTRVANASIQAFSTLFVNHTPGDRSRMIEIVLCDMDDCTRDGVPEV